MNLSGKDKSPVHSFRNVKVVSPQVRERLNSPKLSKEDSKVLQRKLHRQSPVLGSEKHTIGVPKINPLSKILAEKRFGNSQTPLTMMNSPEDQSTYTIYEKNRESVKKSLERLRSPNGSNSDLKPSNSMISMNSSQISQSFMLKSYVFNELDQLREMKKRMDTIPRSINSKTIRSNKNIYDRNTQWKQDLVDKCKEKFVMKKDEDLTECTFSPKILKHKNKKTKVLTPKSAIKSSYTSISPSPSQVAYSTGMDMSKFTETARPLVNYKLNKIL